MSVTYRVEFWSARGHRHTMHSLPPEAVPAVVDQIEIYGQVIRIDEVIEPERCGTYAVPEHLRCKLEDM